MPPVSAKRGRWPAKPAGWGVASRNPSMKVSR